MNSNSTKSKSVLTILETVFPPLSNQEAHFEKDDPEVVKVLRTSDFYMIAGRAEAKFLNFEICKSTGIVSFDFTIGNDFSDPVEIHIRQTQVFEEADLEEFQLELHEKMIRLWEGSPHGEDSRVLEWFTPEKVIWDKSRGHPAIRGFDCYLDAANYDLLYVGIAKVGDSFDRLFKNGHKARQEILSNEPQRLEGARVADEIFLFLFRIVPTFVESFDFDHNFTEDDLNPSVANKMIVADAEKAFVNLLEPEYNNIKFKNYPLGQDGLYDSDFTRYGYAIAEPYCFNTAHGKFRCGRDPKLGFISNRGDCIFIEGDSMSFYRSGVDFSSE